MMKDLINRLRSLINRNDNKDVADEYDIAIDKSINGGVLTDEEKQALNDMNTYQRTCNQVISGERSVLALIPHMYK